MFSLASNNSKCKRIPANGVRISWATSAVNKRSWESVLLSLSNNLFNTVVIDLISRILLIGFIGLRLSSVL